MDAGTGLVHTAPGHGEDDYELGRKPRAPHVQPGGRRRALPAGGGPLRGLTVCEANPQIIEQLAERGALVAEVAARRTPTRTAGAARTRALPRHRAVVHRARPGRPARSRRSPRSSSDVQWIPGWGEERIHDMVAHRPDWALSRQRAWGVPIPAFYCAALRGAAARRARDRARGRDLRATGAGTDEWYRARGRELLPPGTRAPTAAGEVPQGDRHPRRLVRLRLHPRRGAGDPARSSAGRPTCTSRARTSTAAGSTPRCWRRSARAGAPPYRSVLTHGFVVDGEGARCPSRVGNVIAPGRADREVRRRDPAPVGRRRGLHRGHPALRRDPRAGSPTPTGGSATPSASCSATSATSIRARPPSVRAARRARPLGRSTGWRGSSRACARPTRSTSSTRSSTRCTTSARWTSPRSTSTSSRTGSTRRRPTTRGGARRRPSASRCSRALTAAHGAGPAFTAEEVWAHIPARARPESVHLDAFPDARARVARRAPRRANGSGCSRCASEVSRGARDRARQGRIGKGSTRCCTIAERTRGAVAPAARGQGRRPAHHRCSTFGARLRERPPAGHGSLREPGKSPGSCSGRARAGPGLEEVRALLALERRAWARTPAPRRSASAALPVVRALRDEAVAAPRGRRLRPGPGHQAPRARASRARRRRRRGGRLLSLTS